MVGTAYANDEELTDSFGVSESPVANIEQRFFMAVEDDGDQEKMSLRFYED